MDSQRTHLRLVLVLYLLITSAIVIRADLIGYDCEDEDTQLSRVSLLKVKPCIDPRNDSYTEGRVVQLIQEKHYSSVHVYSCLVSIEQIVQYCGMHSHVSAVADGFGRYVHYLRSEMCVEAHRYRKIDLSGLGAGIVANLNVNGTTEVSATLHGYIDHEGNCQGVKYTANGHTYNNAIVSAAISIKLFDYNTLANVEENKIDLRSGTVCEYTSGYCFDDTIGEVAWVAHELNKCSETSLDVLYEGSANILTLRSSDDNPPQQFVIVNSDDTVFALKLIKQEFICNQPAWRTEQSRILVIYQTHTMGFYFQKSKKIAQNVGLMAHVLSKLLFLEIAFKNQMRDIVYDSIYKRCQLRQKMLENRLAIALESPDIISSLIKESPGHVGRIVGETLYIARCSAKIVEIRHTGHCYQELPISYQNQSRFLTPVTHIIQNHGTEVDCNNKLPPMFKLNGKWVELTPEIYHTRTEPVQLDPNVEEIKLNMLRISPISSHGLYTKQEMHEFQKALLFSNEKRAVTNLVTRRVLDSTTNSQGYYIPKIFSGSELSDFAQTTAERAWGFLSRMGNYFSIFALLYTLWGVFCYIGSTVLNFFSLRKVINQTDRPQTYFLACVWQALTNRLLYNWILYQKQNVREHTDNATDNNLSNLESVSVTADQGNNQIPVANNPTMNILQQPSMYPRYLFV